MTWWPCCAYRRPRRAAAGAPPAAGAGAAGGRSCRWCPRDRPSMSALHPRCLRCCSVSHAVQCLGVQPGGLQPSAGRAARLGGGAPALGAPLLLLLPAIRPAATTVVPLRLLGVAAFRAPWVSPSLLLPRLSKPQELRAPFYYDRKGETQPGERGFFGRPVLSFYGGWLTFYFNDRCGERSTARTAGGAGQRTRRLLRQRPLRRCPPGLAGVAMCPLWLLSLPAAG